MGTLYSIELYQRGHFSTVTMNSAYNIKKKQDFPVLVKLYLECTVKYTPSRAGSILEKIAPAARALEQYGESTL